MKKYFILASLALLLLLSGCSSPMKYTNSMFAKSYYENKTLYFTLTDDSKAVIIHKSGPNRGETPTPDNVAVFQKSIEDLAVETELNLKFVENRNEIPKDAEIIEVDLKKLEWIFTLASATMKSTVNYKLDTGNQSFDVIGIHKNSTGGSKEWNLYHSFRNANYLFLKELEKN